MNPSRRAMATLLTGVALGIVLLFGAVRAFWADWAMEDLVLHAILETVTGLTAALGGILLLHRRGTAAEARFVLPALGLVGMGVVCLVHTTTAPGNAFILLRTLADLVGGVLAAFTWLPLRPGPRLERRARGLAWVVLAAASLLVVWVLAARGMFPVMVRDGHFTPALVGMRVIAGLGFLAAACRLVLDAAEQERRVAWPLAVCMLIFGVSSLLFSWWSLWDVRWWAWHVCAALAPLVLVVALAADYAEALRRVSKSEEQFRQVTESLPQLVWTCRADGPCDYLGPQWIAFTGIPEAPQLGYGWLEQLHPDDRERTIKQWSEAAPVGGPFDLEFRIRRHDGVYRWFRTRALPLRDESGHVVKWFGSNLDVEDYKRAEHDLRHTEKQFRTAFENAAVGRSLTRPDGKLAMVNSAFAEMVGLTIEEMQEINVLQITHPEDLRISKESIRCLLAGEQQTFRFEKRYVHKDGHLVWTDVSTTLVRDEQGNPVNFVTDIVDLTQRKKMEEELRLSQRELTIRNRIVEIFLTSDGEQAYDEVMNVFLEAMESKYGVFGYIDENGAYVVPTMTRHIWDNCKVSDKDIVFPRATWGDSSWPTAIREKRTICINEPSVRTPKGHIPITRHISLPLIYRDQVIGLLQVANKQTDYAPADVRLFETIGRFIAPVLDARLQRDRQERIRRESEERFRGFFKLTADLACIATLSDARFIELNPAWEKTLGYTQEELTSRSFIDFIHPDDKEPTLRVVREKLEAGELVLRFENRYLRKDGGVVWLEWTSQPFTATDRTFAIARDITPRKLEEQAASERDWLKSGIVQLNDAVRGDLDLKSLCGKAISQMAGRLDAKVGAVYIVESGGDGQDLELIAGYALQVRPGRNERYGLGEGLVGQAAREKRTLVVRNVPPDYATVVSGTGETSARHILVVPLLVESRVNGVVELASLAEFTPLQQQYLEQSMAVLGVAVEAAQSRDALSQALQHSQQLSEELQAQQEELRATNEELEAQTRALSASEQKLRGQQEELAVTNEELAEKTRLAERRNEDLEEARVVLEEKAKELAQASRYKSQFLANMSHELRTPLNSLLLLAQSLSDNRQGNLTDDQLEAVRVIHASGHDLLNLINDILDLAKIEAGRTELILEPLLLVDAAARLRASFDPLAQKKGLVFTLVVAPDAPAQIVTDGKRFEQVVRNLLSNAFKFTEAGDVTVTFSRPAAETDLAALGLPPEQCLAVSVHDTGIGIASEQQKLIFEAFRQADGGITRRYGGSGLGLAISRELARLLGGEIRLQSELGKGSTFTFLVPLEHPASRVRQPAPVSEPEAEVPSPPVAESGPPPEPDEGYVRRVLVIEDRPADRKAIVELIAEKDITVEEAGTGMEAIEALRRRRFDCVVLDMTLPDISGFEVLQRLRADNVRLPPVVVYTCRDLTREETLMLREHTDAIVLKGVRSTERLLDEVSLFLHQLVSRMPEHKRQILSRIHDSDQQLRDRKVLVVDDDMRTVFALARLLTGHGMRPIKAESGERALALLDEQPDIDLALVDIMMPSMDGFETIRKIRAQERFQKLPVIVLTAKAMKGDREQCLACGASDYLAKPVDQHRLLSMLRVWLYR